MGADKEGGGQHEDTPQGGRDDGNQSPLLAEDDGGGGCVMVRATEDTGSASPGASLRGWKASFQRRVQLDQQVLMGLNRQTSLQEERRTPLRLCVFTVRSPQ